MNHFSRIAYDNRVIWDIKIYIGIGRNQNICTNINFSHNYRIGTNPYIITNSWCARQLSPISLANGYSGGYINIFTEYSLGIDNNTTKMADIKALADSSKR